MNDRRTIARALLLGLALAAIVFAAQLPALAGGFIWDDDQFILQNSLVRAPDGLWKFWFTREAPDYWPLSYTLFWFEWRLWGATPWAWHAVTLGLHAIGAIILWRVLVRLRLPGAWLGALLFGLHPVAAGSSAWIFEAKNTLSFCFFAWATLEFLKYDESDAGAPPSRCHYIASLALFFLALAAKSSTAVLPAVLLLLCWWRRGRITQRDVLRSLPFFALAALMVAAQLLFHKQLLGADDPRPEGLLSRMAASGWAVWFYLYKAVLPIGLSMVYPRWNVNPASPAAWAPLVMMIVLAGVLWRYRKGWPRPVFFALAYYVIALAPALGIVKISYMKYSLVADHWQYLALPAVTALLAAGIARVRRIRNLDEAGMTVAVLIAIAFGGLSWQRADALRSEESLWRDTLSRNPGFGVGHTRLGNALLERGAVDEAIAQYEAAITAEPAYPDAWFNLANTIVALARKPDLPAAERTRQLDHAIHLYREFLNLRPNDSEARERLQKAEAMREMMGTDDI